MLLLQTFFNITVYSQRSISCSCSLWSLTEPLQLCRTVMYKLLSMLQPFVEPTKHYVRRLWVFYQMALFISKHTTTHYMSSNTTAPTRNLDRTPLFIPSTPAFSIYNSLFLHFLKVLLHLPAIQTGCTSAALRHFFFFFFYQFLIIAIVTKTDLSFTHKTCFLLNRQNLPWAGRDT